MMIVCLLLGSLLILSFLVYASYSIQSGIYLRSFCKKRTTEKVVALTFDDGPDPIQTPKVLKVLKEYQATACFFCIGHKIKGNEALLKSMVTEGHLIGNHSYSHSGLFPLYGLSKMKKDLQTCQCELERVTSQPVTLFRPPFGVTNPTIAKAVRQPSHSFIPICSFVIFREYNSVPLSSPVSAGTVGRLYTHVRLSTDNFLSA
jgi:peptidoglycan/xylan/chitin deacetylase (PgdA/CDA1 family)